MARYLFAISLIPIGLSHLVYTKRTVDLVRMAALPHGLGLSHRRWTDGLRRRRAAQHRSARGGDDRDEMLSLFTLLVWIPAVVAAPKARLPWTAFLISWIITAGAWAVARNVADRKSV